MDHPPIDWPSGKPRESIAEYLLWRGAVEIADRSGKASRLIELFRSSHYPGPEARALIADFLERHPFKRPPGRQATPAYRMTEAEANLHQGAAAYRYFKKHRKSHDDALVLALQTDINGDTDETIEPTSKQIDALDAFMRGRRGSTRRMKKRGGAALKSRGLR
jgi:hypothetical protein